METTELKSEFLKKVNDFAKEMQKECDSENAKRGIVILATETPKEGENPYTEQIVSVAGVGGEIIKSISELAKQDSTKFLFKEGLKLATLKSLYDTFKDK